MHVSIKQPIPLNLEIFNVVIEGLWAKSIEYIVDLQSLLDADQCRIARTWSKDTAQSKRLMYFCELRRLIMNSYFRLLDQMPIYGKVRCEDAGIERTLTHSVRAPRLFEYGF
jgi:hypothetical protein